MTAVPPLAYVISPQPWAGFHVSKHHYAIALAERGWQVIFVDPPVDLGRAGRIELSPTDVPGIGSLRYQTWFPYPIKFRSRWLFDRLMRLQARRLVAAAGKPDLVWDFDNAYQFRDLNVFRAGRTFFHLVDDVASAGLGAKNADHIFCLHSSFCLNAGCSFDEAYEVGHGLGVDHAQAAMKAQEQPRSAGPPHIGFVGNLAADWLDWDAVEEMLIRHPEAKFTFWGPLPKGTVAPPLGRIKNSPSTSFPGLAPTSEILAQVAGVDVWLIPFRAEKLLGGPLNSHKVLEYLSTGKAVVMNWLEAFEGNELVNMLDRDESGGLPDLLDRVLADLDKANAPSLMQDRRSYALARTYDRHLDRILAAAGLGGLGDHRNAA